ncbi:MAG: S46 family peptidase, partial [Prevotellaceae bacterium]|nr:S46 family peptidase [Prevotellaceae bacterium]
MKKIYLFITLSLLAMAQSVRADEGMWLLPLIEKLNYAAMQKQGLALSAEEVYSINRSSLKDAVVIFGGGCTGEIISPEGLLLTNHHCGYGIIQEHSSVEHDYLKDGFWAKTRADEIPSPGLSVTFLEQIEDVSNKILPEVANIADEKQRGTKVNEIAKALRDTATKDQSNIRAAVYPMFNGNAYYLFTYKIYEDVRLVGAPPSAIGKFGADTDNWMWPRHTGDFSMFRVYTDKDGNPAEYAADNIPLKPKHHFNVSIAGFEEGDYAMVLGYPGSTDRYMTSWEVRERMNVINAVRIYVRGIRQEILLEDMLADPKVKIQYASKYTGSTNYWKNSIGMNEALQRLKIVEKKEAIEKQFAGFA